VHNNDLKKVLTQTLKETKTPSHHVIQLGMNLTIRNMLDKRVDKLKRCEAIEMGEKRIKDFTCNFN